MKFGAVLGCLLFFFFRKTKFKERTNMATERNFHILTHAFPVEANYSNVSLSFYG